MRLTKRIYIKKEPADCLITMYNLLTRLSGSDGEPILRFQRACGRLMFRIPTGSPECLCKAFATIRPSEPCSYRTARWLYLSILIDVPAKTWLKQQSTSGSQAICSKSLYAPSLRFASTLESSDNSSEQAQKHTRQGFSYHEKYSRRFHRCEPAAVQPHADPPFSPQRVWCSSYISQ